MSYEYFYDRKKNQSFTLEALRLMGKNIKEEALIEEEIYPIRVISKNYNPATQRLIPQAITFVPAEKIYEQTFNIEEFSEQEKAKYKEEHEEEYFFLLRKKRNLLLSKYDNAVSQLNRELRGAEETEKPIIVAKITEWDNYANALCSLPSAEGAPWDGGGEETPWPEEPSK